MSHFPELSQCVVNCFCIHLLFTNVFEAVIVLLCSITLHVTLYVIESDLPCCLQKISISGGSQSLENSLVVTSLLFLGIPTGLWDFPNSTGKAWKRALNNYK